MPFYDPLSAGEKYGYCMGMGYCQYISQAVWVWVLAIHFPGCMGMGIGNTFSRLYGYGYGQYNFTVWENALQWQPIWFPWSLCFHAYLSEIERHWLNVRLCKYNQRGCAFEPGLSQELDEVQRGGSKGLWGAGVHHVEEGAGPAGLDVRSARVGLGRRQPRGMVTQSGGRVWNKRYSPATPKKIRLTLAWVPFYHFLCWKRPLGCRGYQNMAFAQEGIRWWKSLLIKAHWVLIRLWDWDCIALFILAMKPKSQLYCGLISSIVVRSLFPLSPSGRISYRPTFWCPLIVLFTVLKPFKALFLP